MISMRNDRYLHSLMLERLKNRTKARAGARAKLEPRIKDKREQDCENNAATSKEGEFDVFIN